MLSITSIFYRLALIPLGFLILALINPSLLLIPTLLVLFAGVVWVVIKLIPLFMPKPTPLEMTDTHFQPFVSIHVACSGEQATLVNGVLDRLSQLAYKNYEVLVVHNNNSDKKNWRSIERHCQKLGSSFHFYHVEKLPGYKAGALNHVRGFISPKTEVIAIVDADYLVDADFLTQTVGYFADPKVGLVQLPQEYYNVNPNNQALADEYRSFFSIMMNQAQSFDAVTFTGTMGLMRADLFAAEVCWNEWCITEDTEVGIRIHALGYRGVYLNRGYGRGLMPLDYESLRRQRRRWAYGNMQILRKDLISILTDPVFNWKQRLSFISTLTAWFQLTLMILSLLFVAALANCLHYSQVFDFVIIANLLLFAAIMVADLLYFLVGLSKLPDCDLGRRLRAYFVHGGLQWTMSWSWVICLLGFKLPFEITNKNPGQKRTGLMQNLLSSELLLALIALAVVVLYLVGKHKVDLGVVVLGVFALKQIISVTYLSETFVAKKETNLGLI